MYVCIIDDLYLQRCVVSMPIYLGIRENRTGICLGCKNRPAAFFSNSPPLPPLDASGIRETPPFDGAKNPFVKSHGISTTFPSVVVLSLARFWDPTPMI